LLLPSEVTKGKKKVAAPKSPVKASIQEAIRQLAEYNPKYKGKEMAMSMVYSTFKNEDQVELQEGSLKQKVLEKAGYIDYESSGSVRNPKKSEWWFYYSITEAGKKAIQAIEARLESLRMKKAGATLFPNLNGKRKS
jgi:hypothetical protein